ncbi:MAG: type IV toxin-antitoxin system AbiEi family antitoxin domain-containing protein [Deltaproteobacteria bacterium]|nr:type IV toxin-antitoxin system AbiEi family antitoxin domain-containing protein [Deltaproteobacteria bacterium]
MQIIEKFQEDTQGVFSVSDLKGMLPSKHLNSFYRRVVNLEKAGIIERFTRGIYVTTKGFNLSVVSQKIHPKSYISFESILAQHLIIGTVPKREVKAVKVGKKRDYKTLNGRVLHLGVTPCLFFGFETIKGLNFATKEKALLDTLYFYNKGMSFYFDIYSDIDLSVIDRDILIGYLAQYKNPRFVKFVTEYIKGGTK